MLKPITEQEKLLFTMQLNAERGTNELLSELYYDEKYEGYVDIWPTLSIKKTVFSKQRVKLQIGSKKVLAATSPLSNPNAIRYHVSQSKGVKKLTISS